MHIVSAVAHTGLKELTFALARHVLAARAEIESRVMERPRVVIRPVAVDDAGFLVRRENTPDGEVFVVVRVLVVRIAPLRGVGDDRGVLPQVRRHRSRNDVGVRGIPAWRVVHAGLPAVVQADPSVVLRVAGGREPPVPAHQVAPASVEELLGHRPGAAAVPAGVVEDALDRDRVHRRLCDARGLRDDGGRRRQIAAAPSARSGWWRVANVMSGSLPALAGRRPLRPAEAAAGACRCAGGGGSARLDAASRPPCCRSWRRRTGDGARGPGRAVNLQAQGESSDERGMPPPPWSRPSRWPCHWACGCRLCR